MTTSPAGLVIRPPEGSDLLAVARLALSRAGAVFEEEKSDIRLRRVRIHLQHWEEFPKISEGLLRDLRDLVEGYQKIILCLQ